MPPLRLLKSIAVFCFLICVVGSDTFAQVAVVDAVQAPESRPFDLQFSYGYLGNTDLKKSSGDFHRNSFGARFHAELGLTSDLKVDNMFIYEYHNYSFSNASPFQFDDVNRIAYLPLFQWQTSQRWVLMGAPFFNLFFEDGANMADGFTGGGVVGFNYISSPDFSIGLLIGAISQIEDDALVAPIPLLFWRFADHWMLKLGPQILGPTPGVGAEVAWRLSKSVELSTGVQFQRRRFRLDRADQVAQDTVVPVFVKGRWWFINEGSLEFFASIAAGGELRLENKNGNKITEKDYESTPYVGARLLFTF